MKPKAFTRDDIAFLKKMRISPDDVCRICDGTGRLSDRLSCNVCKGLGRVTPIQHKSECPGDGCDCGDTNHADSGKKDS